VKIDRLALSALPGPARGEVDRALAEGKEPTIPSPFGMDRWEFESERGLGLGINLVRGGILAGVGALAGTAIGNSNPWMGAAGAGAGALAGWYCAQRDMQIGSVSTGSEDPQVLKREYQHRLASSVVCKAGIGALLGAGLAGGQWWGPVVGAGLGGYTAWQSLRRREQGDVHVEVDGQKTVRKFYGNPTVFEQSPAEWRTRLYAEGLLGDSIGTAKIPRLEPTAPGPEWHGQASRMVELEQERRLVADLGATSLYGRPTVQAVDANLARLLIDKGQPVFAVTGDKPQDVPHTYSLSGTTPGGNLSVSRTGDWLERKLDYTLTPLQSPADLQKVPEEGHGLPEGFLGLYREGGTTSERVFTQKLTLSGELGKNFERTHRESQQSSRDASVKMGRQLNGTISSFLPLPHLGAAFGAASAGFAALAAFGNTNPGASALLMAAGGLGGWHLATALMDLGVGKVASREY